MRSSLGILAWLLLLCAPAQSQIAETPEQVTGRFISAMTAENWQAMGALMHPNALKEMRQFLAVLFEAPNADEARQQLLGVRTVKEAQALSDTAVFASLMRMMGEQTELGALLKTAKVQVLGHLNEGQDTAHVVYRMAMTINGVSVSRMDVMSLARSPAGWRGLLKGDISALGAGLRAALQGETKN